MKKTLLTTALFLTAITLTKGQIAVFNFSGQGVCPTQNNTPTSILPQVSTSSFTRVYPLTCSQSSNSFSTEAWHTTGGTNLGEYIQVSFTPQAGYILNPTALSFNIYNDVNGPTSAIVAHDGLSTNNFQSTYSISSITTTSQAVTWSFTPSLTMTLGQPITFRIYANGSTSPTGSIRIANFVLSGTVSTTPIIMYDLPNQRIGIGTGSAVIGNKLEINSGTSNTSGLRFTNFKSASSSTQTNLAVNNSGDVVAAVPASTTQYGVVQIGTSIASGTTSNASGLYANNGVLTASPATNNYLGSVKVGSGLNVDGSGLLTSLPASASSLGSVIVTSNSGLQVNSSTGNLSVQVGNGLYIDQSSGNLSVNTSNLVSGLSSNFLQTIGGTLSGQLTAPSLTINASSGSGLQLANLNQTSSYSPYTGTQAPLSVDANGNIVRGTFGSYSSGYLPLAGGNLSGNLGVGNDANSMINAAVSNSPISSLLQVGQHGQQVTNPAAIYVANYGYPSLTTPAAAQFIGNWTSDGMWGIGPADNYAPTSQTGSSGDEIMQIGRVNKGGISNSFNWSNDGSIAVSIDGLLRVKGGLSPAPVNSSQIEFSYDRTNNIGNIGSTTCDGAGNRVFNALNLNNYLNVIGNSGVTWAVGSETVTFSTGLTAGDVVTFIIQ